MAVEAAESGGGGAGSREQCMERQGAGGRLLDPAIASPHHLPPTTIASFTSCPASACTGPIPLSLFSPLQQWGGGG